MATFSVNQYAMGDGVAGLRAVNEQLAASLSRLQAAAAQYTAANAGQAIDGYQEAQNLWNQGMNQMQEALNTHTGNLGNIADNYVEGDLHGRALFAR